MTLEEIFIERTNNHIKAVNEYAKKLNLSYPLHDKDKLTFLLNGYKYYSLDKNLRTDVQQHALNQATLFHITTQKHHPEYWSDSDLSGFTRENFTPNGIINATRMPKDALIEMVCDWSATADEKGNSPYDWFYFVNGTRWKFTKLQQDTILDILEVLHT